MEVIIYMDSNKKVTPKVIWSIVGTAGLACSGVLVEHLPDPDEGL